MKKFRALCINFTVRDNVKLFYFIVKPGKMVHFIERDNYFNTIKLLQMYSKSLANLNYD